MLLVEKHTIKQSHPYYNECDNLCFKAKNLYNAANYIVRQEFIHNKKYLNYYEINRIMVDSKQPDYINLPRKVSNQVLRKLDKNWVSFFKSIKDWSKHPNKYLGRPKLPKYLDKEKGRFVVEYEKGAIKKNNILSQTNIKVYTQIKNIQNIRIVPKINQYTIEVIYEKNEPTIKNNNGIYGAIDLGLNNLITTTFNQPNLKPFIISGKPLKSINQYYNKRKAELQSKLKNNKKTSNKIKKLTNKRNNKVDDYLHKSSRLLVNQLVLMNVSKLVIGYNVEWKQDINIGKVNNQKFVMIPHGRLVDIISYKCRLVGIEVILHEESYTSKCSFLDMEDVCKHEKYMGRRIKRGLFRSGDRGLINADVNGSYNIMRKAIPNVFSDGIEGISVDPIVITIKR